MCARDGAVKHRARVLIVGRAFVLLLPSFGRHCRIWQIRNWLIKADADDNEPLEAVELIDRVEDEALTTGISLFCQF